jgi:hypothetical protein
MFLPTPATGLLMRESTLRSTQYSRFVNELERAVAQHPELSGIPGNFVLCGRAAGDISFAHIARALFSRAFLRSDPRGVVADLLGFVRQPATDVLTVFTIFGVTVEEEIPLSENTSLVPPHKLPQLENFSSIFPSEIEKAQRRIFEPLTPFATSAITYKWRIPQAIVAKSLSALKYIPDDLEYAEFQRALSSIVLCSKIGIQQIHRYEVCLHPGHLWTIGGHSVKPTQPTVQQPELLDAADAQRLMLQVTAFTDWAELQRLTQRLNTARMKPDLIDAHIDLGIVAECALTKGDSREAEIGHRLRTRSAWLLGKDSKERREIAKAMNSLYSRRSSAAHRGTVEKQGREPFEQDSALCRRVLRALLERGSFPQGDDWNALVYG